METDTKVSMAPVPASKIKTELSLTTAGVVLPATMAEVTTLAQYMCKAGTAIPRAMRDNPGECMAVIMDAVAWQMNPFAVARQRYVVESKDGNQTGAYMSQLITAVILKWAPIVEKVMSPIFEGDGPDRRCIIRAHHAESGELMEYISPPVGPRLGSDVKAPGPNYVGIWPKNSPLWNTDQDQQHWYYSIRAWARRFCPGILLGAYDMEEVQAMRDITPKAPVTENALDDGDDAPAHVHEGEVIKPKRKPSPIWETMIDDREEKFDNTAEHTSFNPPIPDDVDDDGITRAGEVREEDIDRGPPDAEGQSGLGLDEPDANQIKVNLMKGIATCRSKRDLEAWLDDNSKAYAKDMDLRRAYDNRMVEIETPDDGGIGKL